MRLIKIKISFILSLFLMVFALASCGDDASDEKEIYVQDYKENVAVKVNYNDSYFDEPSTKYNKNLVSNSMALALSINNPLSATDEMKNNNYTNVSALALKVLTNYGFENIKFNDDYSIKPTIDTMGIAFATKKIKDYTLVLVAFRGRAYEKEWANNFLIGLDNECEGHHKGFYNAAIKGINFVKDNIASLNLNGKIKLWATGFSRAAGVCNVFSGLVDKAIADEDNILGIKLKKEDFYSYTFAASSGMNISSKIDPKADEYNNIFNIINPNDIVPKVPFTTWGFRRYGIDILIPSSFNSSDYSEIYKSFTAEFDKINEVAKKLGFDTINVYNEKIRSNTLNLASVASAIMGGDLKLDDLSGLFIADSNKININLEYALNKIIEKISDEVESREYYDTNLKEAFVSLFGLMYGDGFTPEVKEYAQAYAINKLMNRFVPKEFEDKYTLDLKKKEEIKNIIDVFADLLFPFIDSNNYSELITVISNVKTLIDSHMPLTYLVWSLTEAKAEKSIFVDNCEYYYVKIDGLNDVTIKKSGTNYVTFNVDKSGAFSKVDDNVVACYYNGITLLTKTFSDAYFYLPVGKYDITSKKKDSIDYDFKITVLKYDFKDQIFDFVETKTEENGSIHITIE